MYSAIFAMTVITVIAVTNLFLGFATAMLLGRGPRRWSDIEERIELRPVALRMLQRAPKATVERLDSLKALTSQLPFSQDQGLELGREGSKEYELVQAAKEKLPVDLEPAPLAEGLAAGGEPESSLATEPTSKSKDAVRASAEMDEGEPGAVPTEEAAPQEIKLPPKEPAVDDSNDPPEKTLGQQMQKWRDSELADEIPSMSGIAIRADDDGLDEAVWSALSDAVFKRIREQVRKDRRVLRTTPDQFVWFSADVVPDDALMPVERIRQILLKTTFQHEGTAVGVKVYGAVVAGALEDDSQSVLGRINSTFDFAIESQEVASCLDAGSGPERIEPYEFEVQDAEVEI